MDHRPKYNYQNYEMSRKHWENIFPSKIKQKILIWDIKLEFFKIINSYSSKDTI